MAAIGVYIIALLGIALRVALSFTQLPKWFQSRCEVVTPLTSWERVEEGLSLQEQFISPYSGDVFHETPLALRLMKLSKIFPFRERGFFMMIEIFMFIFLYRLAASFARYLIQQQREEIKSYSGKATSILLEGEKLAWLPSIVVAVHAFSPFSVMTSLAMSTGVISNLTTVITFYYLLQENRLLATLFLALSTYQGFYPFVLIVPVAIHFYKLSNPGSQSYSSKEATSSYFETCSLYFVFLGILIGASFLLEGKWDFLLSTYGFILTVPDLTPNTGVFWYFFTEMFDHFRTFFVCVFQLNAVIYTFPLAVKFSGRPFFLMYILIFLTSIFKSYPSYADAALCFMLLPLWRHTFSYLRNTLIAGGMYVCCLALAPIFYHLWIYAGSANANFYFAITLVYSTAQIFLVTDILFAYLRREYDLIHGTEHLNKDGTQARILLE